MQCNAIDWTQLSAMKLHESNLFIFGNLLSLHVKKVFLPSLAFLGVRVLLRLDLIEIVWAFKPLLTRKVRNAVSVLKHNYFKCKFVDFQI